MKLIDYICKNPKKSLLAAGLAGAVLAGVVGEKIRDYKNTFHEQAVVTYKTPSDYYIKRIVFEGEVSFKVEGNKELYDKFKVGDIVDVSYVKKYYPRFIDESLMPMFPPERGTKIKFLDAELATTK